MDIIDKRLSLAEFADYVRTYDFGTQPANKLVIHHTWRPTKDSWAGERTIGGLKRYYEAKGWSAGPHLFIAEDGIWLFSPMRSDGIHAGSLNHRSIGMEVVGDYDAEVWSGMTKTNALGAISTLIKGLGIVQSDIYFHRDVAQKSCPGWAITKAWLFAELGLAGATTSGPAGFSAPLPPVIPDWAAEAVTFVKTNNLFEVKTDADVRDAVKFHRFYKLIDSHYE